MQGSFTKFLCNCPLGFTHNNGMDSEKKRRYRIADERIAIIIRYAEAFASGPTKRAQEGEQIVSFLVPRNEDFWDYQIPDSTQFEYFAGSIFQGDEGEEFRLFAYLWFDSLGAAIVYVEKKGQTVVGGWG